MSFWLAGLEKFSSFLLSTNTKQWFRGKTVMERNQAILPSILVKRELALARSDPSSSEFIICIHSSYSTRMHQAHVNGCL